MNLRIQCPGPSPKGVLKKALQVVVYGRRAASVVSFASLCVLAFYSFNSVSGIAIFWGALLLLTQQRFADIPCINEVTEVGELRVNGFIALSVLTYLTLLPFPGGIGPI